MAYHWLAAPVQLRVKNYGLNGVDKKKATAREGEWCGVVEIIRQKKVARQATMK